MITNTYNKELPGEDDIIQAKIEFYYYPPEPREYDSPGYAAEIEILRILDEEGNEIEPSKFTMEDIENFGIEIYEWTENQGR